MSIGRLWGVFPAPYDGPGLYWKPAGKNVPGVTIWIFRTMQICSNSIPYRPNDQGIWPARAPLPVSPRLVAESLEGVIFLPQASFGLEFGIKISVLAPDGSGSKPWPLASMRKPKGIALAPYGGIPYNPMVLNQKSFLRIECGPLVYPDLREGARLNLARIIGRLEIC
jgi:hypothetical protein